MDKINFNNNSSPYINDKNLNQLQDNIENELNAKVNTSDLIDLIYPVGSIYMSANNVSPANLFGGTWEQIKDKFLLSAGDTYNAGDEGGEATHTLTINEMPSHRHTIHGRTDRYQGRETAFRETYGYNESGEMDNNVDTFATGGGQAHNNMPPYLAVYMWKRIA